MGAYLMKNSVLQRGWLRTVDLDRRSLTLVKLEDDELTTEDVLGSVSLGSENLQARETLEVLTIVSADSLHSIYRHGRNKL
jgi:hypothetical protein